MKEKLAFASFMLPLPKIHPTPFLFLLYTEWVMLASCGFLAIVETFEKNYLPVQHILILVTLGVMGLMLPYGKPWAKIAYTIAEIALIFYGTMLGYLHILPTLYLIVVMRSCFIFNLTARWAIAILSFVLYVAHQVEYAYSLRIFLNTEGFQRFWMHQLSELLMFALGLLLVLRLANTLFAERHTQRQLASAHERLQQYALQIEDLAAVEERNRIAREIHDSLGHALTALNVQLQTANKLWQVDISKARTFLSQAQRLGEIAIKEVRQSVNALRADFREDEPLEDAIASLVEDFNQATGVKVKTRIYISVDLPLSVVKALYRIVQEAFTNICKHAQATEVCIELNTYLERVNLAIADNGNGFDLDCQKRGFGLQGMQERVAALQGDVQIKSRPGKGCQLFIEIPLKEIETLKRKKLELET
jgi:signal transduction histidine kinase